MVYPFSEDEYRKNIALLKNTKADGRDDVLLEQLKNLDPKAHKYVATFNAQLLLHQKQDPYNMEAIKDYRHIETL